MSEEASRAVRTTVSCVRITYRVPEMKPHGRSFRGGGLSFRTNLRLHGAFISGGGGGFLKKTLAKSNFFK